jgi:hypothetical protein
VISHSPWIVWVESGKLLMWLMAKVGFPSAGWSPSSFSWSSSRRIISSGLAADLNEGVDPAAIAQRQLQAGAAEERHVGPHAFAFDHACDGIVPPGFSGNAAQEDELSVYRNTGCDNGLEGA